MQKASHTILSHLGSIVLTLLLAFCLLLIAQQSFAEDRPPTEDGTIEVVYPPDRLVPYRERRGNWSAIVGIQMDQIFPNKFRSQIDEHSYEDLFGTSPINLIQGQVGMKYNFGLGAIGAAAILGAGQVSDGRIGKVYGTDDDADLQVTKYGAAFSFVMDNIFPEPYIAPYVELQTYVMDWQESSKNLDSLKGQTSLSTALVAGVLIQLNWLDSKSALEAQESSGLQNTFLDVFISQYNSSTGDNEPDFQTDVNYGAGLRFEF